MYKLFFYIIFGIAVILTFFLCTTKQELHQALFVYDSSYDIVETEKSTPEKKTVSKVVKTQTTPQVKTQTQNVQTVQKQQAQAPVTVQKKVTTTPKQAKTVVQNKVQQPINTQKQVQKTVQKPAVQTKNQTTTPKVVQKTETVKPQPQQVMTQEQEEIEWNKWRSRLQNQIMTDTKFPIIFPQGTAFKFSFDVDKYGRVTNVQTWSLTPSFTPYAIQCIAPVIRSYQGRPILDFPKGSMRVTTTVSGQWKISSNTKYSNASNYNDIETVRKGN